MTSLRISFRHPFIGRHRAPLANRSASSPVTSPLPRFISVSQRRLASQDYGSGSGSPEGENPQAQPSSTITSDKEHPGPAPPDVGKGTGGGPTKKDEGGHGPPHSGPSGKKGKEDLGGAQPKILSEGSGPKEESEEVRRHNEDMTKRHDRPREGVDDQGNDYVDKGFWSGHGGADRNP